MKNITCDILVVGAGVAGLCSAIAAARKGLSTILIEKESEIGIKIKGECIRKEARIFNTIFGDGVVFVGDSGGHVGAIAAPGIISSMTTGYDCTNFISDSIKAEGIVTKEMVKEFLTEFEKSPMQKWLRNE